MKPGSVVTMSYCSVRSGSSTYTYKARKDEYLTFIFIGSEPKDGSSPIDVDKFLTDMGWEYKAPAPSASASK